MTLTPTEIFIYGSVWTLVSGGIGWFLNHWLSAARDREREKDQRQRNFRSFLAQWRSELERIPENKIDEIRNHYRTKVHSFHAEKAKVRGDFLPLAEFDRLCGELGGLRDSDLIRREKKMRDIIAEAIDELIRFTKAG